MECLIDEMHRSIQHWLTAAYRKASPRIAQDELAVTTMLRSLRKLGRRWRRRFDDLAPQMAEYFATEASKRVDGAMRDMLRDAGFTVKFKLSAAQREVIGATVQENVSLINSIASEHLKNVEGVVMRSVQTGRDLGTLSKSLQQTYGVTRNRAAFIARSQNNMATAALNRSRRLELGIEEARWLHSAGGRVPRPEHVAFSGKTYKVAQGAYLEGKWTWPGREPNCRCVDVPVIPGFDDP